MSKNEYTRIIKEIEALPTGGITYKKINGKKYAYYQWREEVQLKSMNEKKDSYIVQWTEVVEQ